MFSLILILFDMLLIFAKFSQPCCHLNGTNVYIYASYSLQTVFFFLLLFVENVSFLMISEFDDQCFNEYLHLI